MEKWKLVMVTPTAHISPKGKLILTGVVGHYEIIAMAKGSFYPCSDIVLHLN